MTPADLKRWMEANDVSKASIAGALGLDTDTIRNFLKGKRVHRSTRLAIERLVKGSVGTGFTGAKTATG